jgi:hypothetical protein
VISKQRGEVHRERDTFSRFIHSIPIEFVTAAYDYDIMLSQCIFYKSGGRPEPIYWQLPHAAREMSNVQQAPMNSDVQTTGRSSNINFVYMQVIPNLFM